MLHCDYYTVILCSNNVLIAHLWISLIWNFEYCSLQKKGRRIRWNYNYFWEFHFYLKKMVQNRRHDSDGNLISIYNIESVVLNVAQHKQITVSQLYQVWLTSHNFSNRKIPWQWKSYICICSISRLLRSIYNKNITSILTFYS